ncbi:hypothetical protein [Streptomyces sp. NPDC003635]
MTLQPAQRLTAALVTLVGLATAVYLTVPAALTPVWAVIGLSGVAAVLIGVEAHRTAPRQPWWAPTAGLLTFIAGVTYYNAMEEYFDASNPFPSPTDACYLATYPLFAVGLSGLVRHRWAGHDLPSLLELLIFTAGLALPVWVYLVQPDRVGFRVQINSTDSDEDISRPNGAQGVGQS